MTYVKSGWISSALDKDNIPKTFVCEECRKYYTVMMLFKFKKFVS